MKNYNTTVAFPPHLKCILWWELNISKANQTHTIILSYFLQNCKRHNTNILLQRDLKRFICWFFTYHISYSSQACSSVTLCSPCQKSAKIVQNGKNATTNVWNTIEKCIYILPTDNNLWPRYLCTIVHCAMCVWSVCFCGFYVGW